MANTAQKAILYLLDAPVHKWLEYNHSYAEPFIYRGGLCDEMEHTGIYKIL